MMTFDQLEESPPVADPQPARGLALEGAVSFSELISKHRELSAKIPPFRSLSMGKGAQPDPAFKELPMPPFGSETALLSAPG